MPTLLDELTAIHEENARKDAETVRNNESDQLQLQLQQVILQSFTSLIGFLQSHTTKAEVTNLPTEISTPDVEFVVRALKLVNETLQTHENVDLTPLADTMAAVLKEVQQLPKTHPDYPEPEVIDYSEQLKKLESALEKVTEAINKQETTVEAPTVNVPAPIVKVPEIDWKPLTKELTTLSGLVKKLPTPRVDKSGNMQTANQNQLIHEKYDEYRLLYDNFDSDDLHPRIRGVGYYLKGKKVAGLTYSYDDNDNLTSVKKTK